MILVVTMMMTVFASDIGESNDCTRSDGVYSSDYAESHKVGTCKPKASCFIVHFSSVD